LSAQRLSRTLKLAQEHVPFYRRLFRELGVDASDIRTEQDLAGLPRLQRTEVQQHLRDFYIDGWSGLPHSMVKTSGTTGTGLVFPMTLRAEQEQWAVWWRYRGRFGIDRNTWYAHFYGRGVVPVEQSRPPFWRINQPGRQILFSGYHMKDDFMGAYVDELNRRRPPWIQGYPSLLSLLAGYMIERGLTLDYQPFAVTLGAESLLPQQKVLIEKAFGGACRQHYGTTEAVGNISECEAGRLHVDEDFGCLEFLPNGDGTFRVVATGYANDAFVLVRYELGDDVSLPAVGSACSCGRSGRIVEKIDGRIEDYVVTPGGVRIGRLDHIFKDMISVREAQIFQADPGAVEIRVVPAAEYSDADEKQIIQATRQRLGPEIEICIKRVSILERSRTGKLRFVISRIPGGQGQLGSADRSTD
jgi:phenylacetate-CoA ligase